MYILHDERGADPTQATAIGNDDEDIGLMDYVSVTSPDGTQWVAQVTTPNLNYSVVGSPYDPTILRSIEMLQANPDLRVAKAVLIFTMQILGVRTRAGMSIARFRPPPGSTVLKLNDIETRNLIGLPAPLEDGANVFGMLLNADAVPLALTIRCIEHHGMVAGGTGSGKSNVVANVAEVTLTQGKCVILHDVKPDFALHRQPNSDPGVDPSVWEQFAQFNKAPRPLENVLTVGFNGLCDPREVDQVVGFYASDFPPDLMASLIFDTGDSPLQFDGFAAAANYIRQQRANNGGGPYTI